jgi:5'-phosphate synthase pdxT subunit
VKIGVLALQGDVREHIQSLSDCGVDARAVKTKSEIEDISDLFDLIKSRIKSGMPTYGSCAGMILLSDNVKDAIEGQETFGGIDMVVRRNAFGRQVDSFETDLKFKGITDPAIRAVFIRAPWVESVGSSVEVLAEVIDESGTKHPVAVRSGNLLATSFHPELTGDNRVHKFFVENICRQLASSKG